MEKVIVDLSNEHSVGLGDNLCLLSALANIRPQVELQVSNHHNTFDRLTQYKRIFRIPDSQLIITPSDREGMYRNSGWPTKLFTDYYRPTHVTVNGASHRINHNLAKKCIAVACSFDAQDVEHDNEWPWCRARSLNYWGQLIAHIKRLGYDVITVDHAQHNLEDKVELMVKHCSAIISYEGGMAHLAHMIGLPCFLLDWKLPTVSTTLDQFHCEFVHRTNSVYILRDDDEFLQWNNDQFMHNISQLRSGVTNNRLVNGTCKLAFQGPHLHGTVTVTDVNGNVLLSAPPMFGDSKIAQLLIAHFKF